MLLFAPVTPSDSLNQPQILFTCNLFTSPGNLIGILENRAQFDQLLANDSLIAEKIVVVEKEKGNGALMSQFQCFFDTQMKTPNEHSWVHL